ncbi:hypothetical protein CRE_11586 [Caenorhabditis remanei]|uniref:DNA2/NAM7 helicase helicase domain-containing protein n=1 Tax=Caenorhabditis remanei TaxID=31234 RepID=E3NQB4_CAERE|nr:hypothetical protein CRE_11586 [Caenorhabditis remanei]
MNFPAAPIAMIKQKQMDGFWVDDDDEKRGAPQYGSLFPRIKEDTTKKKRPTGRPQKAKENVDDQCIIGLKRECRHQFETIFKIGDVFRFESSPTLNNYSFWINKKHRQNEIYRYTVEEQKPKGLEIQTVIESHHSTDPEDFKLKADTDFKDDGTPRGDLNEKQFAAIRMALNPNRLLVCIQGPPGTGKSHVLSIFLFKLLKDGKQAVVLTPTKEALKNLKTMTLKMVKQRAMKLHPHALMDVSLFKEILNTSDAADAAIKTIVS